MPKCEICGFEGDSNNVKKCSSSHSEWQGKFICENCFNKILKREDEKNKHFKCNYCENNAIATYYCYVYVIRFIGGAIRYPQGDRVFQVHSSICDKCIEDNKKKGLLPYHEADIDWGYIIAHKGKKESYAFFPYSGEKSQHKSIEKRKACFGVNLVVPFGNGVDEKIKPTLMVMRKNKFSISVKFTKNTKEFLREAEIFFEA